MTRRVKKLIGTVAILLFLVCYALVMMAIAQPVLAGASGWTQLAFYGISGLSWILPIMPIISWMERKTP